MPIRNGWYCLIKPDVRDAPESEGYLRIWLAASKNLDSEMLQAI